METRLFSFISELKAVQAEVESWVFRVRVSADGLDMNHETSVSGFKRSQIDGAGGHDSRAEEVEVLLNGLAVDADPDDAVVRAFQAKGRGELGVAVGFPLQEYRQGSTEWGAAAAPCA